MRKINKKWILIQIEALPYILAACGFCGMLWFLASAAVIFCERGMM